MAYWKRGARTRRHLYFYPSDDLPGVLLLGLFGVAGLVMAGVGAFHLATTPGAGRRDLVLTGLGAALAVVGFAQSFRLARGMRRKP